MLVTDLSEDQKPDVLSVYPATDHVFRIFSGVGDGTFGSNLFSGSTTSKFMQVAKIDLNNDGIADLAVSEGGSPGTEDATWKVFPGKGLAAYDPSIFTFTTTTQTRVGNAVGADMNEDGAEDFILPLPALNQIYVFLSNP
jgi:hypothetical protein